MMSTIMMKIYKKTIFLLFLLVSFAFILGAIDSFRFLKNQKPLFVLWEINLKDGGTTFYFGPGYELIDWHITDYDDVKEKPFYYTKKEIRLFPFLKFSYSLKDIDKNDYVIQYESYV